MKRLKLAKRLNTRLKGVPEETLTTLDRPGTVAVLPSKIPHIKPKLLVRVGDTVAIGTPLFQDKRHPDIRYLSPGGGEVIAIQYGWRRTIDEIVIRLAGAEGAMDERLLQGVSKASQLGGQPDQSDLECNANEILETLKAPNAMGGLPISDEAHAMASDTALCDCPIVKATHQEIVDVLLEVGMWQMIRQFPYMDMASLKPPFPLLILSLEPGDMFFPRADVVLNDRWHDFKWGLAVMEKLAEALIVAAPACRMNALKPIARAITHVTENGYPAGDPGVILYQVKQEVAQNCSITIHLQDLLAIGALFGRGHYDLHRVYALGGEALARPCHLQSRMGSPLFHLMTAGCDPAQHLMAQLKGKGVVAGGLFTGRQVYAGGLDLHPDGSHAHPHHDGEGDAKKTGSQGLMRHGSEMGHMAGDEYSLAALDCSITDQFFGFVIPGADAVTESATFASAIGSGAVPGDLNLHGEERACINCGLCDKKCPVDLLPQFIMKTAQANEMEEVIEMGLLDCTLCGLCSMVCPSKINLVQLFSMTKNLYYKDRIETLD